MASKTTIAWTDRSWNPTVGCDKVSPGCKGCYAEKMGKRLRAMALADVAAGRNPGRKAAYIEAVDDRGRWTGKVPTLPEALGDPLKWRAPSRIFVNSMSDLFHDDVPFEFIAAVFGVMAACQQHTFQVLTKRAARAVEFFAWLRTEAAKVPRMGGPAETIFAKWKADSAMGRDCADMGLDCRADKSDHLCFDAVAWPLPNVHLGVSVENQETADARIPLLLQCPAAVRWVSYEPALERVDFDNSRDWLTPVITKPAGSPRLDWIVVGGESGPNARPFHVQWAHSTIAQCKAAGTACFVKQLGSSPCPALDLGIKDRAGADPSEWPEDLRVQEFPEVVT